MEKLRKTNEKLRTTMENHKKLRKAKGNHEKN